MRDIRLFGTKEWPLHPSMMRALLTCNWKVAMNYLLQPPSEESGEAADTGSAMHAAAHAWHKGASVSDSLESMKARNSEYRRADLQEAAQMFLAYSIDPRNKCVKYLLTEEPIAFSIAPAPEDPTQAPIEVEGTVDQVREHEDGMAYVWDIKTSKKEPTVLLANHQVQVAAYCIGASIRLNRSVRPGGLILPRKYRADGSGPVFWRYPWLLEDTEHILRGVRHIVARIRAGDIWHTANSECCYCIAKTPDICLPKLKAYRNQTST